MPTRICNLGMKPVRDVVISENCKVVEEMRVSGVMNAVLRFSLPGKVSFRNCRTVPMS
jgi:hypothetical protein